MAGRLDDALVCYKRVLSISPHFAEAHNNFGVALALLGRIDEAVAHYERAVALKPDYADAHSNMGAALVAQGRVADALTHCERALALSPKHADVHCNLGVALAAMGRVNDAISHYRRALALSPEHIKAHCNLGVALAIQGKIEDAIQHYERALVLKPDYAEAHNNLGTALAVQGRTEAAVAHYRRSLALCPNQVGVLYNLGTSLTALGDFSEGIASFERALALDPGRADVHNNWASALKHLGRFDDAMMHYEQSVALRPDDAKTLYNRVELKKFRWGDADLEALEGLARRGDFSVDDQIYIHFALGKALEDIGDFERSFEHLRKGNDLKRDRIYYNDGDVKNLFARVADVFNERLLSNFHGQGDPSNAPIFVLGMARSGSTLVEQILASHPQILGAGELTFLETQARTLFNVCDQRAQCPGNSPPLDVATLRNLGQSYLSRLPALEGSQIRIVDKLPGNFIWVGAIRLMMPNARIIHTMRDPIDTCVSCYSKLFESGHNYSHNLEELGRFYRYYRELMMHWRCVLPRDAMLEVSYEDVVDDLEGQARRLIDYCGLPWDDRCVSFNRTVRPIKTASAVQVRQPLFRSSLQRWRNYEAGIAPLIHELHEFITPPAKSRTSTTA